MIVCHIYLFWMSYNDLTVLQHRNDGFLWESFHRPLALNSATKISQIYGGFLKQGYPCSSSIFVWDFPQQKPSVGVETLICQQELKPSNASSLRHWLSVNCALYSKKEACDSNQLRIFFCHKCVLYLP